MKIQLLSDLHNEFYRDKPTTTIAGNKCGPFHGDVSPTLP